MKSLSCKVNNDSATDSFISDLLRDGPPCVVSSATCKMLIDNSLPLSVYGKRQGMRDNRTSEIASATIALLPPQRSYNQPFKYSTIQMISVTS